MSRTGGGGGEGEGEGGRSETQQSLYGVAPPRGGPTPYPSYIIFHSKITPFL